MDLHSSNESFFPCYEYIYPLRSVLMKPNEIRAALALKEIKIVDIARRISVARPSVSQVVSGNKRTPHIRQAIAETIGRPVDEVFQPTNEAP